MGRSCSKHGDMGHTYNILIGNPRGKRPFGKPRSTWQNTAGGREQDPRGSHRDKRVEFGILQTVRKTKTVFACSDAVIAGSNPASGMDD
jgi:hypothetical protein